MKELARPCISLFILLTIITGLIYPLLVMIVGQLAFPNQVHGSLIMENGKILGSKLIGQNFTGPQYFWGRPSATLHHPYNANASGASNLGPTNPLLVQSIKTRIIKLKQYNPSSSPVPIDLITTSASGLDPEISPAAIWYQIARVAQARNLPMENVQQLVEMHTQRRQFGLFGEPRVNVLELNLALDKTHKPYD